MMDFATEARNWN